MFIDRSMKKPKHREIGICDRNVRKSFFSKARDISGSSNMTNRMLTIIVHSPIVRGVNMLST